MKIRGLERCARQHGDELAGRPGINGALASRATGGAGGSGPASGSLAGTAGGRRGRDRVAGVALAAAAS
jgi:hypothetical protein